ncbi:MAG: hypothetical protein ACJ8FS_01705 [Sphingomicrobium sp.]
MEQALAILDDADAPPDIGSHLDLAVSRLQDALHGKPPATVIDQLREEMERLLDMNEPAEAEFA